MNRLISIALVCLLNVSLALAASFSLKVEVAPVGAGSLNTSGGTYEEGSSVYLNTYRNTGYVFKGWYEDDRLLSSSTGFYYTMPSQDITVQARYEYDPTVPGNPAMPDTTTYYTLSTGISPQGAGSLNLTGGRYAAGATVYLNTYRNTGYRFLGWQDDGGQVVSESASFNYTMPRHDTRLTAMYSFDPETPANPDSMATQYTVTVSCRPVGSGSFNTNTATVAEGGNVRLYAYTNTGYKFLRWEDAEGNILSTERDFYYVVPHGNVQVFGIFEFDPEVPSNPAKNYWNKEMGEVIVDDFTPNNLNTAVRNAIGDSNSDDVAMITVAGRMGNNDFGIANNYPNCTLLDLSRVTGVTEIPSYAFDYTKLESVSLPATIERIGYHAFYQCTQMASLTVYAMTPPATEGGVFDGVPEGLVVYVPAAAIAQYQEDEVWSRFALLPIQEDIRSLTVQLPEDCDVELYGGMWLELTNTKSGQRMHYVLTDRTSYTFANIIRNTEWNVVLCNPRGDVFGRIDNVKIEDEDVTATFAALTRPQNVTLAVWAGDEDVTGQVQVTWTDGQGNYLAQGTSLTGLPVGYQANYRIALGQELAMAYQTPPAVTYTLTDGDNAIRQQLTAIPEVKVTGRVKDSATGQPISGATVSASQTFGGRYSRTLNARTDGKGEFVLTLLQAPTSLVFAATDYVSETLTADSLLTGAVALPDVVLKSIVGATLALNFTYVASTAEGEDTEVQEWYSDYQNVNYAIYNQTRQCEVGQFSVQYPQIVLLEEVADGDVLLVTASSRTGAFNAVTATAVVDGQQAAVTLPIVELGGIRASFRQNENQTVVGSLYDANGKLLKTSDYANATLTFSNLPDGQYTLVTMGGSRLFNTIYDLSQLPGTGLADGVDYVRDSVEVQSGVISLVDIDRVPTLDESKLYYTGDGTSFTVNKSSIVAGNYLTLTGRIDFKTAYTSGVGNVQMIVDLPESCQFVENSVMVGNSTSSYTLNGHRLAIPLVRWTDRVRFCIIPTLGGDYAPSAFVQFDLDGQSIMQPIGSASYTVKDLSISVPATVAKTTVPVSGTAIGRSQVEIFDNGVLIGQTASLANGTWATTCELSDPYNLSRHNIYARVTTAQAVVLQSESVECLYDQDAIEVSVVKMYHENPELHKTYELTFDFQKPSDKEENYIYYIYNKKFTFTIDFTNNDPEVVSDVVLYVKTAKSGWHPLTATYDARQDIWVAAGEFGNMYDGDLPVNVSVDFTSHTQQRIDARQFAEATEEVEAISKGFSDNKTSADAFFDAHETVSTEEYLKLCELLELPIDPEELTSDESQSPADMTGAEIEAYLDSVQADFEQRYALLQEELARCSNAFDMTSLYGQIQQNGYTMSIEQADGLTEELLEEQGYTQLPLTDGTNLYMRTNDVGIDFVNLNANVHIRITFPIETARLIQTLRKAPLTDDFKEAFKKLDIAKQTVMSLVEDFQKRLMLPVSTLERHIQELERDIKRINSYILMCNTGSERYNFWTKRLKDAEHTLTLTKAALKWTRPLLRFLARAIPVADYLATLAECYDISNQLADIYLRIPDPCPNDQANANWCMVQDVSLLLATASFAIADVIAEVTADVEIAGGAAAALSSGGTSLAVTGWGIVQKVLAQLGKYALTTATKYFGIKQLRKNVDALRCTDDDPPSDGGEHKPGVPDKKFGIDPSGFVYEGVFSNRVEGATATVFYKEMVEDMYGDFSEQVVKWDAAEYAQENPLFTDENGYYRWDVPSGLWQVKFEKEGYETTYSEWLPVPPPQLDINVAMTQNVQPSVRQARAYEDAVEVEFDKYMTPDELTTENVVVLQGDTPVEGTVQLLDEEVSYEGQTDTYASRIRFNAAEPFTAGEVTLVVKNRVRSYAGIRMQDDYMQQFAVEPEVKQIMCDSVITIVYGQTSPVRVTVLPASAAAGRTLFVSTSSTMMLTLAEDSVTIADDGTATLSVTGELPGTAALTFTVSGSEVSAIGLVSIEQPAAYPTVATPTASIASGSEVEPGTEVYLACETEGATIYYTLDGSCPCEDTPARIVYDGTPIVVNDTTTIRAMAAAEGMGESDVAEFFYTVVGGDGLAGVALTDEIDIYPLPVRDRLNVTAGGRIVRNVVLTTLGGAQVAVATRPARHVVLDVRGLPAGVYVVRVATEGRTYSRKVVKVE